MKKDTTDKKAKPLTLKDMKKYYKLALEQQPTPSHDLVFYDGWLLNLRFPFIHRVRKLTWEKI